MESAFDLTTTQKKAFDELRRAFNRCQSLDILLINHFGELIGFNKKYVADYTDQQSYTGDEDRAVKTRGEHVEHGIKIPGEWADDEHLIVLTDLGLKTYRRDNEI